MACLDEEIFAAYFEFRLSPEETARLFEHIDVCPACYRVFAHCASALASQPSARRTEPEGSGADTSPPMLGRYRIDRLLGMGGMGVVYAGYDAELDRKVAIKLLQPDAKSSAGTVRARLMREAQAMAKLSHPNVINVFEVGTFGEQVFVVMELIDGTTLAGWLAEQERSWRDIVRAFVAAGAGLEAAHRAGIVHRDFKPDNVLVGRDGRICVTDFGLARRIEDAAVPVGPPSPVSPFDATATRSGMLIGTPAYMAPEQMRGELTDERTDVFSFCVALYEALYEARPYRGNNLDELRAAIEGNRVEPPKRVRGPRVYRRAIERGLRARADERPASMGALLARLRVDPIARRRRALALGAVVLAAAGAFTYERAARRATLCVGAEQKLAGVWDPPRKQLIHAAFARSGVRAAEPMWTATERALDEYAGALVAMHTSACQATRLRGEQSEEVLDLRMQCLSDRLSELRVLTEVLAAGDAGVLEHADRATGALAAVADCADLEALRAGTRLPADPGLRAQIAELKDKVARAKVLFHADRLDDSKALATEVAEHPAARAWPVLRAQALLVRGLDDEYLDRLDEALRAFKEAARLGLRNRDDQVVANSWLNVATTLGHRPDKVDEAVEWADLADAIIARTGNPTLALMRLQMLSMIYMANDRGREATDAARQAMALAERLTPPNDRLLAATCQTFANALANDGRFDEARALYLRAIELFSRIGEGESFNVASANSNLGVIAAGMHRFEDAAAAARRALALRERLLPPDSYLIGDTLLNLATALGMLGRFDEAEAALDRLAPIVAKNRDALSDQATQVPWLRGEIALGREHSAEAVRLLDGALGDKALRPINRAWAERALARALWQLGRERARARSVAEDAKTNALHDKPPDTLLAADLDRWLAEHPLTH